LSYLDSVTVVAPAVPFTHSLVVQIASVSWRLLFRSRSRPQHRLTDSSTVESRL